MAVTFEVDAPKLIGDDLAVVGVQRRVAVEMDDRRRAPVDGRKREWIDADLALLQVPVRPHRLVPNNAAPRNPDVDRHRQPAPTPEPLRPRPPGEDGGFAHPHPPPAFLRS